jgi:hypothetical protein
MNSTTAHEDGRILEVYLAEYKHLSSSILASEDGRRQLVNLTTAVIAGSASALTFFQSQPILYLFGGLLLTLLTWIMIEETARTGIHNRYLRFVLGPKIERLLKSKTVPALEYTVFAFDVNPSTTVATVLAPAKYIIGLGLSILLCILFVLEKNASKVPWSEAEIVVFYANVFCIAAPVVLGIISIATLSLKEIYKSFRKNVLKKDADMEKQPPKPRKQRVFKTAKREL